MKISYIIRWFFAVAFGMFTLANGFHWTSIFTLLATILMLPIEKIQAFLVSIKIKAWLAITMSVILLFIGVLNSPSSVSIGEYSSSNLSSSDTADAATSEFMGSNSNSSNVSSKTETSNESTTESNISNSSSDESNASSNQENIVSSTISQSNSNNLSPSSSFSTSQEIKVWIPTNGGKKYHSKSSCSQMKNPIQVTEQEAINRNFTPCGRCY